MHEKKTFIIHSPASPSSEPSKDYNVFNMVERILKKAKNPIKVDEWVLRNDKHEFLLKPGAPMDGDVYQLDLVSAKAAKLFINPEDTIIIVGAFTEICCKKVATDALSLGATPFILPEGTISEHDIWEDKPKPPKSLGTFARFYKSDGLQR